MLYFATCSSKLNISGFSVVGQVKQDSENIILESVQIYNGHFSLLFTKQLSKALLETSLADCI